MDIAIVQSLILLATCLVGSFDVLLLASCILCAIACEMISLSSLPHVNEIGCCFSGVVVSLFCLYMCCLYNVFLIIVKIVFTEKILGKRSMQ